LLTAAEYSLQLLQLHTYDLNDSVSDESEACESEKQDSNDIDSSKVYSFRQCVELNEGLRSFIVNNMPNIVDKFLDYEYAFNNKYYEIERKQTKITDLFKKSKFIN
jgi:hypothetical protein